MLALCGMRLPHETFVNSESGLALGLFRRGRVPSNAITCSSLQRGIVNGAWDAHYHQTVVKRLTRGAPPLRASSGQERARGRKCDLARASDQHPSCGKTTFLRNLRTLVASGEVWEGSKKMFHIPKRETDVREWLVFAIDSLHTSNREIRGELELLPFTARRFSPQDDSARGAVMHGIKSLLPLAVRVPYSNRVAIQVLYTGTDENASSPL